MGYEVHDAVIVSLSNDRDDTKLMRERFLLWRASLTAEGNPHLTDDRVRALAVGPIPWLVNEGETYLLVPDGSKEGWEESHLGERLRAQFIEIFNGEGVDVVSLRFGADYRRDGYELPAARYEPSPDPELFDLVRLILEYGQTDGAHHKQYALDQILRAVTGDEYRRIRGSIPNWDEGISS